MTNSQALDYAAPRSKGHRRIGLGVSLGISFFVGHALVELTIWAVLFYGLGFYHATTNNLFELERFTFSYVIEVVLAAVGGFIVASVFSVARFEDGYRPVALILLAFGLGGTVTGIPWVLDYFMTSTYQITLFAMSFILIATVASAFQLIEAARFQINRN